MKTSILILIVNASVALADCTTPVGIAGQMKYISNDMKFCDGSAWQSLTLQVTGTNCSTAGKIQTVSGDPSFCNGTNWVSMGGAVLSSCSGNPSGKMRYVAAKQRMEWCDGTDWHYMSKNYVAVNIGGSATRFSDGWYFSNHALTGATVDGIVTTVTYGFPISPTPTADQLDIIQSMVYKSGGVGTTINITQPLKNGAYNLYFYCIENYVDNFRKVDILAEGTTVASGVCQLPLGSWVKVGPYPVTVSDGVLNIQVKLVAGSDPLLNAFVATPTP